MRLTGYAALFCSRYQAVETGVKGREVLHHDVVADPLWDPVDGEIHCDAHVVLRIREVGGLSWNGDGMRVIIGLGHSTRIEMMWAGSCNRILEQTVQLRYRYRLVDKSTAAWPRTP